MGVVSQCAITERKPPRVGDAFGSVPAGDDLGGKQELPNLLFGEVWLV